MNLTIVRHGQTHDNVSQIIAGHVPGILTPLGIVQARLAGKWLKDRKFDRAYSSDSNRCVQTLNLILNENVYKNVPIILSEHLRERFYGTFEGKPRDEGWQEFEKARLEGGFNPMKFSFGGGETIEDVQKRSVKAFWQIISECLKKDEAGIAANFNESILVVSHGGTIRTFLADLFTKPLEEAYQLFTPNNTAITSLNIYYRGGHYVEYVNSVEHLLPGRIT